MNPLHLLLILAIGGFLVWIITLIPMPPVVRTIIFGLAAIFAVLLVLQAFGVSTGLPAIRL